MYTIVNDDNEIDGVGRDNLAEEMNTFAGEKDIPCSSDSFANQGIFIRKELDPFEIDTALAEEYGCDEDAVVTLGEAAIDKFNEAGRLLEKCEEIGEELGLEGNPIVDKVESEFLTIQRVLKADEDYIKDLETSLLERVENVDGDIDGLEEMLKEQKETLKKLGELSGEHHVDDMYEKEKLVEKMIAYKTRLEESEEILLEADKKLDFCGYDSDEEVRQSIDDFIFDDYGERVEVNDENIEIHMEALRGAIVGELCEDVLEIDDIEDCFEPEKNLLRIYEAIESEKISRNILDKVSHDFHGMSDGDQDELVQRIEESPHQIDYIIKKLTSEPFGDGNSTDDDFYNIKASYEVEHTFGVPKSEVDSLEEAIEYVENEELCLNDRYGREDIQYVEDSFTIDREHLADNYPDEIEDVNAFFNEDSE